MAVSNSKTSRRIGFVAAVLASVALPGMAFAEPGGRGGWRGANNGDSPRQERSDDNRGGGRQNRPWQQAPQQQSQAAQQAPQQTQQGGNWNRGQTSQQSQQGGGWNRTAVQQPAQQGGGWNRGSQQPQQQTQHGGNWSGSDRRDGDSWRERRGGWQQQQQPAQQTRQGGSRVEADGRNGGNWRDRDADRRDGNRTSHWGSRNQNQGHYQGGYYHGDSRGDRRWDNRWRHDNRYDWQTYRRSHPTYFRVGAYYAPYRNYSYRRVTVGFFLDSLFFGDRYWINDPWQYRLPEVYGPYRWVRYYDDAVLVDSYSGEVVDVIYNFFW